MYTKLRYNLNLAYYNTIKLHVIYSMRQQFKHTECYKLGTFQPYMQ